MTKLRPIAIYLPQFHPTQENDTWWGKGFTEWTNVTKAKPRFLDHYQPHLPSDLGFYDLRLSEAREEQAKLAQEYGIEGFCYYHYWFNGRRILEKPLDGVLNSDKPDFPFCICWANENWTRRWDGQDADVLLEQSYNHDDDREHIRYLCESVFSDQRYITVDGKPVFIIYRADLFPNMAKTIEIWREEALSMGFTGLYIAYMQSFNQRFDPKEYGFDAAIEFQPDFSKSPKKNKFWFKKLFGLLNSNKDAFFHDRIFLYKDVIENMMAKTKPNYKCFPSAYPMWDNSARRKSDAYIVHESTPELYGDWLQHIVSNFKPYSADENFIFINAWNEWAEGNHLEPCQKWGRKYLEVTKDKLSKG
jgi:lipopolysaccharide biosynthesis protein